MFPTIPRRNDSHFMLLLLLIPRKKSVLFLRPNVILLVFGITSRYYYSLRRVSVTNDCARKSSPYFHIVPHNSAFEIFGKERNQLRSIIRQASVIQDNIPDNLDSLDYYISLRCITLYNVFNCHIKLFVPTWEMLLLNSTLSKR